MKVVVTGGSGFVGQHTVAALLANGHAVTVLARDPARLVNLPWRDQVSIVEGDLHSQGVDWPKRLGVPDALAHLAWPGLPNYRELFHFEQNLPADYRFLKAMIEAGLPKLLVTGTCFEYGMKSGELSEDLPSDPQNPYALAKDTLRKFLEALQHRHPFILQWLRLFYLYGPGQNPNSLLAQLDRAIDEGMPQFDMSGGEQLRDYLPIEDVARRLARLAVRNEGSGIINICSGEPISVRRLVENRIAERGARIRPNLGFYPYPDYEPMAFWGANRKFAEFDVKGSFV